MKTLKLADVLKMTLIAAFACTVIACGDGEAEDAGEAIDQAVTDAGNAVEDACEDVKEGMKAEDTDC
ncbi:hypothetical protein [Alteromonas lipolytica]|uniref:Uncharacterized protein n=1 Tax=Alteromonas lipolytica TaxID=1856405 RepID=A0A1E8FG06_9ALTE|nr:hypothetical protein [Alteromonas lipolytica]OFI34860.1 hypothetical protein BFC17_14900 [Alteromonas lipolytica]GGF54575.1 hypothetical protein GCM10011338_03480 [Alteromonas lipolytica]